MSLDDDLILYDKVSEMTCERLSAIKSSIQWPERKGVTTECVVTAQDGLAFALLGDSGSFVLNQTGALVGLLIAGVDGRGTGYVTPIQEIWEDVRTRTGHEIELD